MGTKYDYSIMFSSFVIPVLVNPKRVYDSPKVLFCLRDSRLARSDSHFGDTTTSEGIGDRTILLGRLLGLQFLCPTCVPSLAASGHEFRCFKVRKEILAYPLDDVTERKVGDHDEGQLESELGQEAISVLLLERKHSATHGTRHLEQLQPVVEFRNEFRRSGKRNSRDTEETIVQGRVFRDTLSERTTLEVDDECRYLLTETEQVDGRVEKGRGVFCLDIDGPSAVEGILSVRKASHKLLGAYSCRTLASSVM